MIPSLFVRLARSVVVALAFVSASVPSSAADSLASADLSELLAVHDLKTSVAVGNRYLKQQSLIAVRDSLARLGRERKFGKDWKRGNPQWDAAEKLLVDPMIEQSRNDWSSLQWLGPEWEAMGRASFTREDLDALLSHFRTDIGRKQVKIIDHSVAFHVAGSYGMSGRLIQDYPGTEQEQKALTYVWDDEDKAMRFSIEANENIDGQRFALSPLGAKYQRTLIIKLTGILNARIDKLAAQFPAAAAARLPEADSVIAAYQASRTQ